jgi:serine/threonine-protein kinase
MARSTRLFGKMRFSQRRSGDRRASNPPALGLVGRYVLREEIGRGAMGEVWRAEDPNIGRAVAVKILRVPEGLSAAQVTDWEQRFIQEARAAGVLSHPGIVTVHDVGMTLDDRPFIVMELVEGASLDAILQEGPRPPAQACLEWGAQVAEALHAAHDRGIVHRDVKPANILIDQEGRSRITDFGIARLAESELTQSGSFLGSPAFASPEQILMGTVDGRSDLFSLGATLYLLLTGERPFRGNDLSSLTYAICHLEPAPIRELSPAVPQVAEAVVMRALAKDPQRRFATGRHMAEYLRGAAELSFEPGATRAAPVPIRTRRRRVRHSQHPVPAWAMIMVLLALAAAGATGLSVVARGLAQGRSTADQPAALPLGTVASLGAPQAGPWAAGNESSLPAVDLRVAHDLDEGTITLWAGPRRLLRAPLRRSAGEQDGARSAAGDAAWTKQHWTVRLPAGDHRLRVEVASADGRLRLEGETPGTVRAGQSRRLHVRVKERPGPRLELLWTGS